MSILITGSSKGLGRSLALQFAKEGHSVIIHGRDKKRLADIQKQIRNNGGIVETISGDLTKKQTIDKIFEICTVRNEIDIFINNAGLYYEKPMYACDEDEMAKIKEVIDTNFMASINLITMLYNNFLTRKTGLIININSLAAKGFNDKESIYCATKWGLRGFLGSLRYEARKSDVSILDVYLGAMNTDMMKNRKDKNGLIDPDEVALIIYHLCHMPFYHPLRSDIQLSFNINEIEIGRRK